MRKVFQSYDGLIFEDEEECAEYERKNSTLAMYGLNGRTNDPNEAFVVVINDDSGAASFISMCDADSDYPGIDEDSTGIFAWVHDQIYDAKHYIKISGSTLKALNHYFTDIK